MLKVLIPIIIGAALGIAISQFNLLNNLPFSFADSNRWLTLAAIPVSLILGIIIHEFGHLVFGLTSGYRFSSFRVGPFVWFREDSKIRFSFSKSIFAGQCLMAPVHDFRTFKYVIYNLGGVILNLVLTAAFFVLFLLAPDNPGLSAWEGAFLVSAILNLLLALQNLIPIRPLTNDGANVVEAMKSIDATRGLFMMFHVNNMMMQGVRYRDMDEKLFEVNKNPDHSNYLVAYMFILKAARLDDQGQHDKALELYNNIELAKLPTIYRYLIKTNIMFHHTVYNPNHSAAKELYQDKGLQDFLKSDIGACICVSAAYTFFVEGEKDKGLKILARGKKVLEKTPNKGERMLNLEMLEKIEAQIQGEEKGEDSDDTSD